jgi:SAM-dependent methyltransferase
MSRFSRAIRKLTKDAAARSGKKDSLFKLYPYMHSPKQLVVLTELMMSASKVSGCFVEVGCAYGVTTVFLNKFLEEEGIARDYFAIDTFGGFVAAHADYEIRERGKPVALKDVFSENSKAWFDRSMAVHGLTRVKSVQCDATTFDFSSIGPIAFCLLDIDLYLPIKDTLPKIFAALAPGGVLVVDDCQPHPYWDGAQQAYDEYVAANGLQNDVVAGKLGVIRRPA